MKSFVALVLTLALGLTTALDKPDNISVVCDPSEDGLVVFVPHPYECHKFFMCQGSVGIAMDCPGNLQFDPSLNVCNFEWAVHCVNTPYPTTSTTTMEPETTTMEDETTTMDGEETTMFADYEEYYKL